MRCPQYCTVFVLNLHFFFLSFFEAANPLIIMFVDFCFLMCDFGRRETANTSAGERSYFWGGSSERDFFFFPIFSEHNVFVVWHLISFRFCQSIFYHIFFSFLLCSLSLKIQSLSTSKWSKKLLSSPRQRRSSCHPKKIISFGIFKKRKKKDQFMVW